MIDVLIPTYRRKTGLAITLASLFGQTYRDISVTISDQSPAADRYLNSIEIETILKAFEFRGVRVQTYERTVRRGLAEQREFLLTKATAPYVLFLDDDVLLEPTVVERMLRVIAAERCGFVGCAATGLRFLEDERPHEQQIELWDGPVTPEPFEPGRLPLHRHLVNNAANPLHLERQLVHGEETLRYKVAWVGGANVLYDRQKLLEVGGFSFWERLPPEHAGEEVLAQFLLIRRFGGCGILPSGTYHLGLPTTVENRTHNAAALFDEMVREAV
ncbi:MAG TPA: glycosyltransferase family A protein [Candidatus Aquilonibacter sp.]|nr:glycosyltransferase family A protein [Candidatus Aquilonibacter sp.]